jgi:hypothetical protein
MGKKNCTVFKMGKEKQKKREQDHRRMTVAYWEPRSLCTLDHLLWDITYI